MVCDQHGMPLAMHLTPVQKHESPWFEHVMDKVCLKRKGRGRPRKRAFWVIADRGYSAARIRKWCRNRGIVCVIPSKKNEKKKRRINKELYKKRNVVERMFSWLKENRRVATRYDKLSTNYLAFVQWAAIRLMLRRLAPS